MLGGEHRDNDGEVVDLVALLRGRNWSDARIIALGNTCAAAAAKETFAPHEGELAKAVAAALSGRTVGISQSDLRFLADADLIDTEACVEPTGDLRQSPRSSSSIAVTTDLSNQCLG